MSDRYTLEEVQREIQETSQKLHRVFRAIQTPDNVGVKRDRFYGRTTVNMLLNLDEFSINKLKEMTPQIEALMQRFRELREQEAQIAYDIDVREATRPDFPTKAFD